MLIRYDVKASRQTAGGEPVAGAIANGLPVEHPDRLLTATPLGVGRERDDLDAFTSQMPTLAGGFENEDAGALIRESDLVRRGIAALTLLLPFGHTSIVKRWEEKAAPSSCPAPSTC